MKTNIRNISRNDYNSILDIDLRCFENLSYSDLNDLKENMKGRKGFVATHEGTIVGFLTYKLEEDFEYVYLKRLAVEPDVQKNGIGMALITRLLKEYPNYTIALHVRETDLPFQLYLKNRGFKTVKPFVMKNFYSDSDESCYYFEYRSHIDKVDENSESEELEPQVDKNIKDKESVG
jgi:ribosomal protein S18 acetylase RimI-like enzyme